jgi:hypothetical protein
MVLVDVEKLMLIVYYKQIATESTVYELTDGPTGEPAEDPPYSDRYWDVD